MNFVVEDGSGHPLATSYCSVEHADMHHSARPSGRWWSALGRVEKQQALIAASATLDDMAAWRGKPAVFWQGLGWPRRDVPGVTADEVPRAVARTTAELAWILAFPADEEEPPGFLDGPWPMVAYLAESIRPEDPRDVVLCIDHCPDVLGGEGACRDYDDGA